jgi:hypothetical protein
VVHSASVRQCLVGLWLKHLKLWLAACCRCAPVLLQGKWRATFLPAWEVIGLFFTLRGQPAFPQLQRLAGQGFRPTGSIFLTRGPLRSLATTTQPPLDPQTAVHHKADFRPPAGLLLRWCWPVIAWFLRLLT